MHRKFCFCISTGSRWGCEKDKVCGKGFGPQEEFYGCSDIGIDDVQSVVYNDPILHNETSAENVGLNDLGSSKTDWGKRKKTQKKTQNVHNFLLNSMKNDVRPSSVSVFGSDPLPNHLQVNKVRQDLKPRPVDLKANHIVYASRNNNEAQLLQSPVTKTSVDTPVIPDSERTDPAHLMDAARRFLEDVTYNAIVNYYGKGDNTPKDVNCKATVRYERNPIVQHYCSSTCIQDNFKCPALLCTCSLSNQADLFQTDRNVQNQMQKVAGWPSDQNINVGYLKTFVGHLIDKNRLLDTTSGPTDLSNIPTKYIKQKTPNKKSGTSNQHRLGRVKVAAYGKPKSNSASKGYTVSARGSFSTQDNKYFNKLFQDRKFLKTERKAKVPSKLDKTPNKITDIDPTNVPSKVSLFDLPSDSNTGSFNSFLKSTIQKTDIANTKLAPSSSSKVSDVPPKVLQCTASREFQNNPFMKKWCMTNCPFGFCPTNVCQCDKSST